MRIDAETADDLRRTNPRNQLISVLETIENELNENEVSVESLQALQEVNTQYREWAGAYNDAVAEALTELGIEVETTG